MYRVLLYIVICLPISCCFVVRVPEVVKEPNVAVAVLWNVDSIYISSPSTYTVCSKKISWIDSNTVTLVTVDEVKNIVVTKLNSSKPVAVDEVSIIIESPDEIRIGTSPKTLTRYRKRIEIKKNVIHRFSTTKTLTAVNILPIEEYLYGVVSCEIGMAKENEYDAIKAQAVCARSYTMSLLNKRKDFDLYGSYLYDQEYKGKEREYQLAIQAVNDTRGEIMQYKNEPILAQYHACCGGRTAFGRYPYLKSVADAPHHSYHEKPYCRGSPYYEWNVKIARKVFDDTLLSLAGINRAFSITPKLEINKITKRVDYLKFNAEKEYKLAGETIRKAFSLKSAFFTLKNGRDSVEIQGHGWGHGIGLCQYGALEMARQKISYKNILKHYYTGIKLVRNY